MSKYMPIEMSRSSKFGSNYWEAYSHKLQRNISLFNDLEYYNWLTVEMDPDIIDFCERPIEVELLINGKLVKSIPDIWILYKNQKEEFWNVLYQKDSEVIDDKALYKQKEIEQLKIWCSNNNYNFKVQTEKTILLGNEYINNLSHLCSRVRRVNFDNINKYREELKKYLRDRNSTKISEIINFGFLPFESEMSLVAYFIYEGTLKADLIGQPFTDETEVLVNG